MEELKEELNIKMFTREKGYAFGWTVIFLEFIISTYKQCILKTEIPNQICHPFKSPASIKSRKADLVARAAGKIIYLFFLILGLGQAFQTFPGQCLKVRILLKLCVSGVVQE